MLVFVEFVFAPPRDGGRMKTPFRPFVLLALVSCGDASTASGPVRPVSSILFIGNSLTMHGPSAAVDWNANWGMAASEAGKDYAHQLSARLPGATHVELNAPGFEANYRSFDVHSLDQPLQAHPDLIVVQLGDNVTDASEFERYYNALITHLGADNNAFLLCVSTWWNNPAIDVAIRNACTRPNGSYVDISRIYAEPGNRASSERSFRDSGVGAHPGDRGMSAIADALYRALRQ